ncbi:PLASMODESMATA CALLOSE-BINDING PROTEIN 5 [Nymphaea thermarum]|nr:PLASMODESMATA CALLOSE-BINDING PROTEIN 5 [Nymphaea thermarum]
MLTSRAVQSRVGSINNRRELDTYPVMTVPVISPLDPGTSSPIVTSPGTTPTNTPPTTPITTPTNTPTASGGQKWCIASPSASQTALQVALDYACGYGGADCSAIQQGGSCFNPDTVRDHASYAFNNYYQKNPVDTSCVFGGTAMLTTTNPNRVPCRTLTPDLRFTTQLGISRRIYPLGMIEKDINHRASRKWTFFVLNYELLNYTFNPPRVVSVLVRI